MPEVRIVRKWVDDPEQYRIERALEHGYYTQARRAILEADPDDLIKQVADAGLRGRGGAGAPCGMKWGFMPKEPTPARPNYLICNCDESEPGTYNNRELIEHDPHQLLDGMIIAAKAIRIHTMFIYCRGEFRFGYERLEQAIQEAYARNFLGKGIFGSDYDLELILHRGAGAYICGEETALMDSLEGRRGHPRAKPPFPANAGLYGMPTTINNVETLCNLPHIMEHGVEWYRAMGTERSTGTKIFSVSGHVKKPANYEIIMGTPLRELVYDIAGGIRDGHELKAVIPGGSSMPMLPAEIALECNMDFEDLQAHGTLLGSGGFMVFDDSTDIVQVCQIIARFYKNESCGKCVPCRIGTDWIYRILTRIVDGRGRTEDLDALRSACISVGGERMMDSRSFCPLGDAAAWPIIWGGMKHFLPEFEYWIEHGKSPVGREPGFPAALSN